METAGTKQAAATEPYEAPTAAVVTIIEAAFGPLIAALAEHPDELRTIYTAVAREGQRHGLAGVVHLAESVSQELTRRPPEILAIEIHLFPPSIRFGGDDQRVDVSPSVGGPTTPDGRASVGLQVDVNASGEGPGYLGRGTISVDVDSSGKPKGASIEWKCVF